MSTEQSLIYANINDQNVVTNVIVINPGSQEPKDFIANTLGLPGVWLETNDNGLRKNQAGVGYTYSEELDAFIPPKPYESWLLDEDTCTWVAPILDPSTDETIYDWDESVLNWVEINQLS